MNKSRIAYTKVIDAEMLQAVKDYITYKKMLDDADREIETIKAKIQSYMIENGLDCFETEEGKVRWKEQTANKFDSSAFKAELPDLYKKYTKPVTSKPFYCNK